jgi:hypothetical protein
MFRARLRNLLKDSNLPNLAFNDVKEEQMLNISLHSLHHGYGR